VFYLRADVLWRMLKDGLVQVGGLLQHAAEQDWGRQAQDALVLW
jgi:hypothetical protein